MNSTDDTLVNDDSGSNVGRTIFLFGIVNFLIFGCVYAVIRWCSRTSRYGREDYDDDEEEDNDAATEVLDPEPKQKFVHARQVREPQPGDAIYDKTIIGGTSSLGILLFIGATIVIIIALNNRRQLQGASPDDFVSLGATACRIDSAFGYRYYDASTNLRNGWCQEEWEYLVQVNDNEYFVPAALTEAYCQASCEECASQEALRGPNYYTGVDNLRQGTKITNETLVECFAPTVDRLDYYDCGVQQEQNGTCYLLENTANDLQKEIDSINLALIATYVCYAASVALLVLVAWFVHRNRQVRRLAEEAEGNGLKEVKEQAEDSQDEEGMVGGSPDNSDEGVPPEDEPIRDQADVQESDQR